MPSISNVMKMVGKEIPRPFDGFLNDGNGRGISGTRIGNTINRFFSWAEGIIVGNWVNHTFG